MYHWLQRLFSSSGGKAEKPFVAVSTEIELPVAPPPASVPASASVQVPAVRKHERSSTSWMQRDDVNASFTNWLFEGSDHSDLFTNKIENDILALLEKTVNSEQSGADMVRRMPGVIPQLLNSLRTEAFSGKELARRISHDVVLVAAVVRLANNSSYNAETSITSIEHAVLVLGQTGLRQLITSVAFRPIIDLKSGQFTRQIAPRIWDQSEKCAIANRMLAEEEGVDPFEAFLAGLIQNVGLIVSLRVMDQMADGDQPLGSASFFNSFIGYGRTLSCSIAREWHFPESVVTAIEEQGTTPNSAHMTPLGKILALGDYLSKMSVLIGDDRLRAGDAHLMRGLSPTAVNCLAALKVLEEVEDVE